MAVNPSGSFLYAASQWDGNLSSFSIGSTGQLTFKDATTSNQNANKPSCGNTSDVESDINGLTVDPTGKYLFMARGSYKDSSSTVAGGILIFLLDTSSGNSSGAFTQVGCLVATNGTVKSTAVDPTGKYLYAINGSAQYDLDTAPNKVLAYSINSTTGELTAIGEPLATGSSPTGITVDRGGKYVYVANSGDNTISSYAISATTGALTLVGTTATGNGTQPQAITSY